MTTDNGTPSFQVNAKTVGFVLSLVALFTMLWNATGYFNTQANEIEKLKEADARHVESVVKYSRELESLREEMVKLTIAINTLTIRLERADSSGK